MQSALKLFRQLSKLPVALASIVLFALMVMIFADVMMRSAFNAPFEAATELTRWFMAIIVFLMLPIISGQQEHIVVDLTDSFFLQCLGRTHSRCHHRPCLWRHVDLACAPSAGVG